MLIGKINAGRRQKILVTIREIKKIRTIDVRVHEIIQAKKAHTVSRRQ